MWQLGGMLLERHPEPPSPQSTGDTSTSPAKRKVVKGNVIIAQAASEEEVLAELRKDCYATDGVWDLDRVEIRPFESLFRMGKGM